MSLFNSSSIIKIISVLAFIGLPLAAQAQTPTTSQVQAQPREVSLKGVSFSYMSWTEFMTLDSGTGVDEAYANFYGTAISYEKQNFRGRIGTIFSGSFLFGQANGGGTQTNIIYQKAYKQWFGAMAEYKYAYRLTPQITLGLGPMLLFRQISWELTTGINEIKSGATVNLGGLLDARLRFSPNWELRQTFGTLAFKASTLWSVGIGYTF